MSTVGIVLTVLLIVFLGYLGIGGMLDDIKKHKIEQRRLRAEMKQLLQERQEIEDRLRGRN